MTEQYATAAQRHLRVGGKLLQQDELDDAGYHFGIAGECALKEGLRNAGVTLRKHFPELRDDAKRKIKEMTSGFAFGRTSSPLHAIVGSPQFENIFERWKIEIRYADARCTPVTRDDCVLWQGHAEDLVLRLVML